jgi:hypothetical protein
MGRVVLIFAFIFISAIVLANNNYRKVDSLSVSVPDTLKTAKEIANYLVQNSVNEKEKVRAFYIWISHNLKYDLSSRNTEIVFNSKRELVEDALNRREGRCLHYSELFHEFCQQSGIKSFVITGYSRQPSGDISTVAHTWNAVYVDSGFYNIDVTWAAGYLLDTVYIHEFRDDYFLIEPKVFIHNHLPFDPVWQFIDNPITFYDFNNQNFSNLNISGRFNYLELITQFGKQDKITNLEEANKRIMQSGELNDLILAEISKNVLEITNEKCRIAIDTLNNAIDKYNLYISYKNNRFNEPAIGDDDIKKLILEFEKTLFNADAMFQNVFTVNPDLNSQLARFKNKTKEMEDKLKMEKEFVDKYTRTLNPLRFFLFH